MTRLLPLVLALAACGWHGKRDPKDGEEDAPRDDCLFMLCDEDDGVDTGVDPDAPLLGKWTGTCALERSLPEVRVELRLTEFIDGGFEEPDRYVGQGRIAFELGATSFVSTGAGHLAFTEEGGVEVHLTASESGPPFMVHASGALERDAAITGRCDMSGTRGDFLFNKVSAD